MHRYTIIFETKKWDGDRENLITIVEKCLRKISPVLEQKIILDLPNLYILIQTDKNIDIFNKALIDSLKERSFTLKKYGFGWWEPVVDGDKPALLRPYIDPNYAGFSPQLDAVSSYSYKWFWIIFAYLLSSLFVAVVINTYFQNIYLRTIILIGYLIYLVVNIRKTPMKISCTDNEIVFKPLMGPITRFQWKEIRSLKVSDARGYGCSVKSSGNRQGFSYNGLPNKETLIKTIIYKSQLALAETTFSSMIYLRF